MAESGASKSKEAEIGAWCESRSRPRLSVAPMMGWTTPHFRQLLRMLTQHTLLYTEMYPADAVLAVAERSPEHLRAFLGIDLSQQPLAVQLGGREPVAMAAAARHCAAIGGIDEININVGCPSDMVSLCHCYGAALMKEAAQVQLVAAAVRSAVPPTIAVTVKHRLGVDDCDSWEQLVEFVRTVSAAPANIRHFVVHARKAILGLSTADNRDVPPLRRDWVFRLAHTFPHVSFELNGEVGSLEEAQQLLMTCRGDHSVIQPVCGAASLQSTVEHCRDDTVSADGSSPVHALQSVMIGRAAFRTPWMLARADSMETFKGTESLVSSGSSARSVTRRQIVLNYANYAEVAWKNGRLRLEEDVRHEMSMERSVAPSAQTIAHRLKPRLAALREALYLPLMNLFEEPAPASLVAENDGKPAAKTETLSTSKNEVSCSIQWRKRLEKSIGKRAAIKKAALYALRAVTPLADLPADHMAHAATLPRNGCRVAEE